MKHTAIYALYSSVVKIREDESSTTAYDADGNVVSWDVDAVATKQTELENAAKLDALRTERTKRLIETDHYGLSDQTMSSDMKTYRQALRDITDNATSLDDVKWPTKP